MNRSKIKGMLVGGAIGDALGAPIETWPPEKTAEVHGGPVRRYVAPIGHKWFKPEEFLPGMTTDDTQLTIATLEGLLVGHGNAVAEGNWDRYMDAIAKAHVEAMQHSVGGWGKTTTEAIRRIANGVHWSISGKTNEEKMGTGNGVPMKCAPLAAWYGSEHGSHVETDQGEPFRFNQRLVAFSAMTHYTQMSAFATLAHVHVLNLLLWTQPGAMKEDQFFDLIGTVEFFGYEENKADRAHYDLSHLNRSDDDIKQRFYKVYNLRRSVPHEELTVDRLREEFGGGSCYLYDSLPFSYAMFLRNSDSMESIIETANAGGDSDTNAKFVGEMLGAYHGIELFEQPENRWAIEGLRDYEKLIAVADKFCDTFGV